MSYSKVSKKLAKAVKKVKSIGDFPGFNELTNQIAECAKDFIYPDAPNMNYVKPTWVGARLDVGPYQPNGEDLTGIKAKKHLKKLQKAKANLTKAFNIMKEDNSQLYAELDLHKPLDLVQQFANELEKYLLSKVGI